MIPSEISRRDADDKLASFHDRFDLPADVIYLDGNSLGALPKAVAARIETVVKREWGHDLIKSWNLHNWIGLSESVGAKIARLIGAKPTEVVATDSTSVNLFKALVAAARMRPGRKHIVTELGNFPTDVYMIEGAASALSGAALRACATADLAKTIDQDTAVVLLTHVHYKSARMHDMAALTKLAHDKGALVIWDLSHSTGAVDVDLNGAGADFAVGCGYKYLNGGPGAPAFLFVAERHQAAAQSPLSGWMGHAAPFAFEDYYRPADGMKRHLCGTPLVIGLSALDTSIDLILEAGMPALAKKGRALGDLFIALVEEHCAGHGLVLASPRESATRGSHVSFAHPDGYAIMQALIARGVIGDFRDPDILRFGFASLYLRYADIWQSAMTLKDVLTSGVWREARYSQRAAVT